MAWEFSVGNKAQVGNGYELTFAEAVGEENPTIYNRRSCCLDRYTYRTIRHFLAFALGDAATSSLAV